MNITEVRIKLVEKKRDRFLAFVSIVIDGSFVVKDLKLIDGCRGKFVSMPSERRMEYCEHCGCKNHLRANYCNKCGCMLRRDATHEPLYLDIAHPITAEAREAIHHAVIQAYEEELKRAELSGSVSTRDDLNGKVA